MDIQRGFRLGPWSVSPLTGEIESGSRSVHLEPKVMEVLVVLAERAESLVLRDELLEKVWGPRAAISDEPLTRCVAQLRQSLGDSSRNPTYIQTVPKRGYRLLLPVSPLEVSTAQADAPSGSVQAPGNSRPERSRPWRGVAMISALAVVGFLAYLGSQALRLPDFDWCNLERDSGLFDSIGDDAKTACNEGIVLLNVRNDVNLYAAMQKFRLAIELARPATYGSAVHNLARAMVLLPTYVANPDPIDDCYYDERFDDQVDCYDAALKLLRLHRREAPYIDDFSDAILGYIATKQWRWFDASGDFEFAMMATADDADMWQWLSQFRASVGDLDGALAAITRANALNPTAGVILDRFGVILMWQGDLEGAREKFAEARRYSTNLYEPSQLVFDIRDRNEAGIKQRLRDHANVRRVEDASWIEDFVDGLLDPEKRDAAVLAVERAIERRDLHGQYIYAAWAYLGEDQRAADAVLTLIEANPLALDVEFLFAPENRSLRSHDDFGTIIDALGLDLYWLDGGRANCPSLFDQAGERRWC